jgi:hypothetical protein
MGRRSETGAGSASEMPTGCDRIVAKSVPAAEAMTPCKRGVSDLGCGREHDRRRGQISWSLTPRSIRRRGDDRGEVERSATHADRVFQDEKPPLHIYLQLADGAV